MPEPECDVVIVDDDVSLLRALSKQVRLMGYEPRVFSNPAEAFEFLRTGAGKCLLLDQSMPQITGLQLQSWLVSRETPLSIVFLSGQASVRNAATAMRAGAVNFLEKPVEFDALKSALSEAIEKQSIDLRDHRIQAEALDRFSKLTQRQRHVFRELVQGASNKEIALSLGITERTVKAHRSAIREKLGVITLAELVSLGNLVGTTGEFRGPNTI